MTVLVVFILTLLAANKPHRVKRQILWRMKLELEIGALKKAEGYLQQTDRERVIPSLEFMKNWLSADKRDIENNKGY